MPVIIVQQTNGIQIAVLLRRSIGKLCKHMSSSSDNQFEVVAYVCFTIIFFKISSTLYE